MSTQPTHPLTRFRSIPLLVLLAGVLAYVAIRNGTERTNTMSDDGTGASGVNADAPRRYVTRTQFTLLLAPSQLDGMLASDTGSFAMMRRCGITGIAVTATAWLPSPGSLQLEYGASGVARLASMGRAVEARGFDFGVVPVIVDERGTPARPALTALADIRIFYSAYGEWIDKLAASVGPRGENFLSSASSPLPARSAGDEVSDLRRVRRGGTFRCLRYATDLAEARAYLFWNLTDGVVLRIGSGGDNEDSLRAFLATATTAGLPVFLTGFDGPPPLEFEFARWTAAGVQAPHAATTPTLPDSLLTRCAAIPVVHGVFFSGAFLRDDPVSARAAHWDAIGRIARVVGAVRGRLAAERSRGPELRAGSGE